MTERELQAIRERWEAATPGPWVKNVNRNGIVTSNYCITGLRDVDAYFIAAARTDVPALLAEVERLREEINELKSDHKHAIRRARGND